MGAALIPMAVSAIGSTIGASMLGPTIGAGLASVLPTLTEGIPAAVSVGTDMAMGGAGSLAEATGLFGIPSSTLGGYVGKGIGGVGGSLIGNQIAKGMNTGTTGPVGSPGLLPLPTGGHGMQTPSFQFQTVGIHPSAVIGAQRSGDILDLLRRMQQQRA